MNKKFDSKVKGVSGVYRNSKSIDLKYDIEVNGDPFKVLEAKNITIIATDIRDNNVKTYGPFGLEDDHGAGVNLNNIYDDHVCISYITNVSSDYPNEVVYILNLNTGEYVKNTLLINNNNESVPSSIIADAGDYYLVFYNSRDAERTFSTGKVFHTQLKNTEFPVMLL